MRALITRKSIVIASVAVFIAIVTAVSVNVFDSAGPATGLAHAVTRPIRSLALAVARTFENIYSSIYKYEDLQAQYDEALRDIAYRERDLHEADELRQDNNRLRALLGFRERHAGHVYEEAVIIDWSSSNWSSSFTISKGYENSETTIARGNCVITEYGVLIGVITEVSALESTVVTVLDTTFSASAYVGGEMATVKGDFELMSMGLVMLDHIDEDLVLLPGDSVVTSGASAVYPARLVIGEIEEVFRHSTGVGRYATIRPIRPIDITIVNVYIITSFDIYG